MRGGDGDDVLIGGTARDVIFGGDDNDTLEGGRGNDDLTGDEGSDTYRFVGSQLGVDAVFEDAAGDDDDSEDIDTLNFSGLAGAINVDLALTSEQVVNSSHLRLRLSSSTGIENVVGTAFEDTIKGNSRDNVLRGEGLKDRIYGRDGNDTLLGGGGDDHMFGEGGFDRLEGGAGRDFLDGGVDGFADELVGGGDRDTFVLRKRRGSDPGPLEQSLVDYNSALDAIIWGYY
jgi:Ca2+-binding RTX toxin-like protein